MKGPSRRDAIKLIAATGVATATSCERPSEAKDTPKVNDSPKTPVNAVLGVAPLGFVWQTQDPFLFCVHHDDKYPEGNDKFGPATSLAGRNIGSDFKPKDGWRMYHGEVVPGFPQHPHRGFETVTVVREGLLDHSDSLGAAARYGGGDVQWLTAGKGINHAEMFPLLNKDKPNPLELFQIWLNLPASDKMVDPHFTMLWNEEIPQVADAGDGKAKTRVAVIAGSYQGKKAPSPPPSSWASRPDSDVAIWTLKMEPSAQFTLPAAKAGTSRMLYFFSGTGLKVDGKEIPDYHLIQLKADVEVELVAGSTAAELLMLQAKPIGEPVAHQGPFVMNTQDELRQAFTDYRNTRFGGWSWSRPDPVHGAEAKRFARHADGKQESPA